MFVHKDLFRDLHLDVVFAILNSEVALIFYNCVCGLSTRFQPGMYFGIGRTHFRHAFDCLGHPVTGPYRQVHGIIDRRRKNSPSDTPRVVHGSLPLYYPEVEELTFRYP